ISVARSTRSSDLSGHVIIRLAGAPLERQTKKTERDPVAKEVGDPPVLPEADGGEQRPHGADGWSGRQLGDEHACAFGSRHRADGTEKAGTDIVHAHAGR